MDKSTGTVVRIMDKGYGFISVEGREKDLFFHMNSLVNVNFDDLREGDALVFDLEDGPKGPSAVNVERAGASAGSASDDDSEMEA